MKNKNNNGGFKEKGSQKHGELPNGAGPRVQISQRSRCSGRKVPKAESVAA